MPKIVAMHKVEGGTCYPVHRPAYKSIRLRLCRRFDRGKSLLSLRTTDGRHNPGIFGKWFDQ
jgi:hypothetical protein